MAEESQEDAHKMTPEMRYYYRNREERIHKVKEKYNNNPEVIAKRKERENKKVEKEAEKEAKRIEKERIRQEKLLSAESTKRQFKERPEGGLDGFLAGPLPDDK